MSKRPQRKTNKPDYYQPEDSGEVDNDALQRIGLRQKDIGRVTVTTKTVVYNLISDSEPECIEDQEGYDPAAFGMVSAGKGKPKRKRKRKKKTKTRSSSPPPKKSKMEARSSKCEVRDCSVCMDTPLGSVLECPMPECDCVVCIDGCLPDLVKFSTGGGKVMRGVLCPVCAVPFDPLMLYGILDVERKKSLDEARIEAAKHEGAALKQKEMSEKGLVEQFNLCRFPTCPKCGGGASLLEGCSQIDCDKQRTNYAGHGFVSNTSSVLVQPCKTRFCFYCGQMGAIGTSMQRHCSECPLGPGQLCPTNIPREVHAKESRNLLEWLNAAKLIHGKEETNKCLEVDWFNEHFSHVREAFRRGLKSMPNRGVPTSGSTPSSYDQGMQTRRDERDRQRRRFMAMQEAVPRFRSATRHVDEDGNPAENGTLQWQCARTGCVPDFWQPVVHPYGSGYHTNYCMHCNASRDSQGPVNVDMIRRQAEMWRRDRE